MCRQTAKERLCALYDGMKEENSLLCIFYSDPITRTRTSKILSLGTMWLLMLVIDLWFFYSRASQCCTDLRQEFNCPLENGAECMGWYYCHDMLNDLNVIVDQFDFEEEAAEALGLTSVIGSSLSKDGTRRRLLSLSSGMSRRLLARKGAKRTRIEQADGSGVGAGARINMQRYRFHCSAFPDDGNVVHQVIFNIMYVCMYVYLYVIWSF